jgi:hypothetical protein
VCLAHLPPISLYVCVCMYSRGLARVNPASHSHASRKSPTGPLQIHEPSCSVCLPIQRGRPLGLPTRPPPACLPRAASPWASC